MKTHHAVANPFLLMMDPESVLRAVESSERLNRLERHVCRPLDKPMLGGISSEELREDDGPLQSAPSSCFQSLI